MTLEETALTNFDKLREAGEIHWEEAPARHIPAEPFDARRSWPSVTFEFRIAASLTKKPFTAGVAKPSRAFTDSHEDFVIVPIGARHRLILNKYCVVRPQFVLHTLDAESQDDPLNADDLDAAWSAISSLGDAYTAIFNCGADAGASVSHKHLQVIPRARHVGLDRLFSSSDPCQKLPTEAIPFQLAADRIDLQQDGGSLRETYAKLLGSVGGPNSTAHNAILTKQYMVVIPRRKAVIEGFGSQIANAAAMMGLVWCSSEQAFDAWGHVGPMIALEKFGVSKNVSEDEYTS